MSRIILLLLLFSVFSYPSIGNAMDLEYEIPDLPDDVKEDFIESQKKNVVGDDSFESVPTIEDMTEQAIDQTGDMGTLNVTKESGGTIFVVPKEPTPSQLVPKTFPNY